MARICTVCSSPKRSQIDTELAGGNALAAIAKRHRVGRDSLRRHRDAHLTPAMVKVSVERYGAESAEVAFDATVVRLESLLDRLDGLLGVAEERKSLMGGANVAREIRQCLELVARLRGELQERPAVAINVLASPEIVAYSAAIARVIELHPEIRADVVREFQRVSDLPALTVGVES